MRCKTSPWGGGSQQGAAASCYCFFCVLLEDPAALLGELLLGELLLGLELAPLEDDDLSLEELGEDDDPEELGLLLLGELDIEPDEEPDEDEPEGEDSGLLERLEPEAPVDELAPRSQP